MLVGCSNQPVSVAKGNVSVVGAAETKISDRNIHFSEDNVNGKNFNCSISNYSKRSCYDTWESHRQFAMMAPSLWLF